MVWFVALLLLLLLPMTDDDYIPIEVHDQKRGKSFIEEETLIPANYNFNRSRREKISTKFHIFAFIY